MSLDDLLDHPEQWDQLAFLVKVRPQGDVLTAPIELFGVQATLTGPVTPGSVEFWTTGYDLVVAAIEDLDAGGPGRIPEITEAWTFELGPRLRGLHPVSLPDGWTWDPRRDASYRSRDGKTWGHLPLMLAGMRMEAGRDEDLSDATRARRRGMLKVSSLAAAFGLYCASFPRSDATPGARHRVITSEGIITLEEGTPEHPGAWSFPPGAALVQGAARLLATLLIHEVRTRGGSLADFDTDGGFILATPEGGPLEPPA